MMRVLVTGHEGYIGCVLVPMLVAHGHEVVGLDSGLFRDCAAGGGVPTVPTIGCDVRDVDADLLRGFDAVIHLAALSNDPLGNLNPECTYEINYRAAVRLAHEAKKAGVPRFLQSSTCSVYGKSGDAVLDESAEFQPVTPYGKSKVYVEREVSQLADDSFCPTFLRNATAYGFSARHRGDLVVNNLVGYAYTTGKVLLKSDGTPWRPLVHIEDISQAFLAVLNAPWERVHNQAFNVGATDENYTVRQVAETIEQRVDGSRVEFQADASPDTRCYRVNCDKIREVLPEFKTQWTVAKGVDQLLDAYQELGLTLDAFESSRFFRIKRVCELQAQNRIGDDLRWIGNGK